jgi:hypothetical protein
MEKARADKDEWSLNESIGGTSLQKEKSYAAVKPGTGRDGLLNQDKCTTA